MFCGNCGKEFTGTPDFCPHCGTNLTTANEKNVSSKSRLVTTLLCIILGYFGIAGIHRFYLGKIGTGILMLITLGGLGIWTLVDFIFAVAGKMKDKEGKPITKW